MPMVKVDGVEVEVPQGAALFRRARERQGRALEAAE